MTTAGGNLGPMSGAQDPEDLLDHPDSLDDPATNTADDELDALVLFADVDFTDPAARAQRSAEWAMLFGADQ